MIQLTDKVWAVEVPDSAENIRVSQLIGSPKLFADLPGVLWAVKLPPGTWRFLFTTKAATEEDARRVVGNGQYDSYGCYNVWSPYGIIDNPYDSAAEALSGLLRSKNLDENKNYALIENINTNGK